MTDMWLIIQGVSFRNRVAPCMLLVKESQIRDFSCKFYAFLSYINRNKYKLCYDS